MATGIDNLARGLAAKLATTKADLVNGKIPASQLPSYVDDIIEGYFHDGKFYKEATYETEIIGETDKVYVDIGNEAKPSYRWSGSTYVFLSEIHFDDSITSDSSNAPQSKAVKAYVDEKINFTAARVESVITLVNSSFDGNVKIDDVNYTPKGSIKMINVSKTVKVLGQEGTLPSKCPDTFTQGRLASFSQGQDSYTSSNMSFEADADSETLSISFTKGFFSQGKDNFSQGELPTYKEGVFDPGTLPQFEETSLLESSSAEFLGEPSVIIMTGTVDGSVTNTYEKEDKQVIFNKQ